MLTVAKVQRLERDGSDALRRPDVASLSALPADDLVCSHCNAQSENKGAYLRRFEDGTLVHHSITVSEETTTIVGETALVTARMTADVSVGGMPRAVDSRALAVWINTPGGC